MNDEAKQYLAEAEKHLQQSATLVAKTIGAMAECKISTDGIEDIGAAFTKIQHAGVLIHDVVSPRWAGRRSGTADSADYPVRLPSGRCGTSAAADHAHV